MKIPTEGPVRYAGTPMVNMTETLCEGGGGGGVFAIPIIRYLAIYNYTCSLLARSKPRWHAPL